MAVKQVTFYVQTCREPSVIEGAPEDFVRYGTLMAIEDTSEAVNYAPQLVWQFDSRTADQRGRGKHDVPTTYTHNGVTASLARTGCFKVAVYTVNLLVGSANYTWWNDMQLTSDNYMLGQITAVIQP